MSDAATIAKAIRAALEELAILEDDAQGACAASTYLDRFADAERAALEVLSASSPQ